MKLKVLWMSCIAETFSPSSWQDLVCYRICQSNLFWSRHIWVSGLSYEWVREVFSILLFATVQKQALSSELSSTLLPKLNLLPFLICYFSRDLCNAEPLKCLSSKIYFPKCTKCQISQDFFSPISLHCTHIFSLHFILPDTVKELYRLLWSLGKLPAQVIKRIPHFCEQFISLIPSNNLFHHISQRFPD